MVKKVGKYEMGRILGEGTFGMYEYECELLKFNLLLIFIINFHKYDLYICIE